MTNYGKVQSTVKPEPIKIDDYSVWVHENIVEVENENFTYEYDMVRYDIKEYILERVGKVESDVDEVITILAAIEGVSL